MPFFDNLITHLDPTLVPHCVNYEKVKGMKDHDAEGMGKCLLDEVARFKEFSQSEISRIQVNMDSDRSYGVAARDFLLKKTHSLNIFLNVNRLIVTRLLAKYRESLTSVHSSILNYIDTSIDTIKSHQLQLKADKFNTKFASAGILSDDVLATVSNDDWNQFENAALCENSEWRDMKSDEIIDFLLQSGAYKCAKCLAQKAGFKINLQNVLDIYSQMGTETERLSDFLMSCAYNFDQVFLIEPLRNLESLASWKSTEIACKIIELIKAANTAFEISPDDPIMLKCLQFDSNILIRTLLYQFAEYDSEAIHNFLDYCCRLDKVGGFKEAIEYAYSKDTSFSISPELLICCCKNDSVNCLDELLRLGLPINYQKLRSKRTPLIESIRYGARNCGLLLLEKNASPYVADCDGWNAFDHDIYRGFGLVSERLGLDKGVKNFPYSLMETLPQDLHTGNSQEILILWYKIECADTIIPSSIIFSLHSCNGTFLHEKKISVIDGVSGVFYLTLRYGSVEVIKKTDSLRIQMISFDDNNHGESSLPIQLLIDNPQIREWPVSIFYSNGEEQTRRMLVRCLKLSFDREYTDMKRNSILKDNQLLIGHRGFGANIKEARIQLQENTIMSFLAASKAGAEYIEFDVQVTRDEVPVLFHDFTFRQGNLECSISSITLKQFKSKRCSCESKSESTNLVKSEFATLKEAFRLLPQDLGFNIEIKYPSSHEIDEIPVYTHQPIDLYCDVILKCVFDNCGDRKIFFSSFNPEICLALKLKQDIVPVFILTDGGYGLDSDCMSVRAAAKFAHTLGLNGIVCESKILVSSTKILQYLKSLGIHVMSYGECNNFDEDIRVQLENGIDGVIVDRLRSVLPVMQGHRKKSALSALTRPTQ